MTMKRWNFYVCCTFMCTGVSGEARGQECPPTTDDPHFVEHPTRDMRHGKHIYILPEHYQ